MLSFRGRPMVLYDAVEDGGGGGSSKKKNTVASGYMAAGRAAAATAPATQSNPNGYVSTADLRRSQTTLPENQTIKPTGDSKITNVSKGGSGSGNRVSYIGSDGSKKSGTVKVTPGKTPDYYTELGNLYQQAYDDQIAANNAALEEARQRAQETTDAQIAALAEQYAGTNRQLYRDYMNNRRVLPQQMAAMGYNGGLSESSLLRLGNAYEEGLNENERARLAQETAYNQELAQQLYDAQMRTNEANQAERKNLYGNQATLKQMIYADQQQRAATMAASGDFSEYERLGFSPSEIAYLKQMWRQMNPTLA